MSIFDRFLDVSPLTFQLASKFTSATPLNPKKHVLFEGELTLRLPDGSSSLRYFKVIDRKLLCSSVTPPPPPNCTNPASPEALPRFCTTI